MVRDHLRFVAFNPMARKIGPRIKLSRRYGVALFGTKKEMRILQRRPYPPGQHGPAASGRLSGFATQLREKQKAKLIYGILERQFRKYFEEAFSQTGDTGKLLLQILELRLDNVVYRLGLATTRAQARQMVTHGHIHINGKLVNIPSYRVRAGEVISLRPESQKKAIFNNLEAQLAEHEPPSWLELDRSERRGKVLNPPPEEELERNLLPQLIVEFYSR